MSSLNRLMDIKINLKMTAKQLNRDAMRAAKEEKTEKAKVEKAIKQGHNEVARVHAQNAVRKQSESINLLQLSSRVDAVAGRVQTAITMQQVTGNMARVSKAMEAAMKTMNPERITAVMDNFEKSFNDLDVVDEYTREATSSANAVSMPQDEVDKLMAQAADKAGVELSQDLQEVPAAKGKINQAAEPVEEDYLSERLRALRN
ncbi:hypothetical protein P280DRAFT_465995 [Massarina eburnea CBS 473.64]|uniref:Uncharacterized protein n=1 Tax=Massarina eburnea CBS 473.64 TaxID=1395130 RepID=A0A6A6SAC2_9PLEO|nr:hypothetical protein P280DRAFT_465995 [Massarina eburnea CBS 473.64]